MQSGESLGPLVLFLNLLLSSSMVIRHPSLYFSPSFIINVGNSKKDIALVFEACFNYGINKNVVVMTYVKEGVRGPETKEQVFPFRPVTPFEVSPETGDTELEHGGLNASPNRHL